MDVVIYILSASILLILILFAVKLRSRVETGEWNIDFNLLTDATHLTMCDDKDYLRLWILLFR